MKRKAKPKRQPRVTLSMHLPQPVIGYLRFIAELSGVKLNDVANVVLSIGVVEAQQKIRRQHEQQS